MSPATFNAIAERVRATDLLVFERALGQLTLTGGYGRGSAWAGVVEVPLDDEALTAAAVTQGRIVRIGGAVAQRVIGPYWSAQALIVPVGDSHVVVFGGSDMERVADAQLVRHAAEAVSASGLVPTDKLLADELEVVHAVRSLMEYRPESVVDAARHIARVTADALGCEVGGVLVMAAGEPRVAIAGEGVPATIDQAALTSALTELAKRGGLTPNVEDHVEHGVTLAGVELVSRMALQIGGADGLGLIVVGHSSLRPRGFTLLCQRVGRSIAEAAETLLEHALVREQLAEERDKFERQAHTDALTGLANRAAWDDAIAAATESGARFALLAFDVRSLKQTNDSRGHAAGDELLVAAADSLRSAVREHDLVARLGGDEFGILLRDADASSAVVVRDRVTAACLSWSARSGVELGFAAGAAEVAPGEPVAAAFARADAAMLADKHP